MLESDVTNDTTRSTERKLKDFFRSCLDEVHRNDKGGKVRDLLDISLNVPHTDKGGMARGEGLLDKSLNGPHNDK